MIVTFLAAALSRAARRLPRSISRRVAGATPALDHGRMDTGPALYTIRISGHLGATMLSAFPAMTPRRHGAETVLTGLLDRSALYGVLSEIDALGLDLLEVRQLMPDAE